MRVSRVAVHESDNSQAPAKAWGQSRAAEQQGERVGHFEFVEQRVDVGRHRTPRPSDTASDPTDARDGNGSLLHV